MTRMLRIGLLLMVMVADPTPVTAADPPAAPSEPRHRDEPLPLRKGDTLALVGGTLVERQQHHGHLEALLQCAAPQLQLRVRNVGWSGDDVHGTARAGFDPPAAGYDRMLRDLQAADPTVVLVAYGFAEASSGLSAGRVAGGDATDGAGPVQRFRAGLHRLIDDLQDRGVRVVLLRPFPLPGIKTPGYADAMRQFQQAVDAVAAEQTVPVLEAPLEGDSAELFTSHGLNPSEQGYARMAEQLAPALLGTSLVDRVAEHCSEQHLAALRRKIIEKNRLFFHRYRPQNETYLFLFRKHEQGNNAVEIRQFDPLIQQADAAIWQLAGER